MLMCLGISEGVASVFDTDDFTTEKIKVRDLLDSGLEVDNFNRYGESLKYKCITCNKFCMFYRIIRTRLLGFDYKIIADTYKVCDDGSVETVFSLVESVVSYPDICLWFDYESSRLEFSISYYDKHYYAEDNGKTLTHRISYDKNGGVVSDKMDDGYKKGAMKC